MIFEGYNGAFAVIGIAVGIAVWEPRCDLSQIARPDRFAAQCTDRLAAWRPAIHQDKSHLAPPDGLRGALRQRATSKLHNSSLHKRFIARPPCSEIQ